MIDEIRGAVRELCANTLVLAYLGHTVLGMPRSY